MRPSHALCARLRFTTKEVGKGFYRGNRTGSMGAHTEYGGYTIDWRKVRNYNVPDMTDFNLTPFVTREMEPKSRLIVPEQGEAYTPKYLDAKSFLQTWKVQNPQEYDEVLRHQEGEREKKAEAQARKERDKQLDRIYAAGGDDAVRQYQQQQRDLEAKAEVQRRAEEERTMLNTAKQAEEAAPSSTS